MFGHQDDQHHHHDDDNQQMGDVVTQQVADSVLSTDDKSTHDDFNPALPTDGSVAYASDAPAPQTYAPAQDFGSDNSAASATDSVSTDDASSDDSTQAPDATSPEEVAVTTPGSEELLNIKQQALSQLSPLINHLDQNPEEKFRTTMMMIQANDDQSLINVAYEAAQAIADEKVKAQALLDIVNEINYFTAQQQAA